MQIGRSEARAVVAGRGGGRGGGGVGVRRERWRLGDGGEW